MVTFRMSRAGWLVIALCVLFGIELCGLRFGPAMGALLIASLLMHEVGHMLVATTLGVPVREFGICLAGAYNRRASGSCRRDEVLISAAGPVMNLCLVFPLLLLPVIGTQLALCNLALCLINLLTLPASDGLRILRTMRRPFPVEDLIPALSRPPALASPLL